jgi:hypothetical protein
MIELSLMQAGLVPIVIGLVAVLKNSGLPTQYAPITSIVLSVAGVIALSGVSVMSGLIGVIVGLSACGLYSGAKTTAQV